jgi:MFS family permease
VVGHLAPLLDTTIVDLTLGARGRDLHTSLTAVQWVVTAYLLALAMTIPATGWLAGRFGAKRMWLLVVAGLHRARSAPGAPAAGPAGAATRT